MICGNIDHKGTYDGVLKEPLWQEVFAWLKKHSSPEVGKYELRGDELFASVEHIETKPRNERRFEAHNNYLDLHYCIKGGEYIEWAPRASLAIKEEYIPEKDCAFYVPEDKHTAIHLTPGTFAIFYPEDAHMPKIHDGLNNSIYKAVFKIHKKLVY